MSLEKALRDRLLELVAEGLEIRDRVEGGFDGRTLTRTDFQKSRAWLAAALQKIELISGNARTSYTRLASKAAQEQGQEWGAITGTVGEVAETLRHMVADIDAGLLGSISDKARAETFGNFLEHGQAYLSDGKVREAGVIVGVVFEDAIRRICRKHSITEKDINLDNLISALVKRNVITDMKAKRARVAATVRTKATHAQWNEFTESDVVAALGSTRELVENQLDGSLG